MSIVAIVNEALDLCSAETIASLDENTINAERANRFVVSVRQQLIAAFPWSFAKRRVALAAVASNDRDGIWGYAYQKPTDCLRLMGIAPNVLIYPDDLYRFPWEEDAGTVYSDLDAPYARYLRDIDNTAAFTPGFRTAYVTALAGKLCLPITKDIKRAADLRNAARQDFVIATTQNANEADNDYGFTSSYDTARASGDAVVSVTTE